MKRIVLAISLLFTTLIAVAQTPAQRAKLNAKYGIRDIKLDTHKSLYNDLYRIEREIVSCGETYKRRNENLMIGGIKVQSIEYLYIKGYLHGIYVYFNNLEDLRSTVFSLVELYSYPKDDKGIGEWDADYFTVRAAPEYLMLTYTKKNIQERCAEARREKVHKLKDQL